MIGIVVPAHNEEGVIVDCLACIQRCARHPQLLGEPVEVVVVADACTDETRALAVRQGVVAMAIDARNVGRARATGAQLLLSGGARWLAFADADTLVSDRWLVERLALEAEAVCGTVAVEDWTPHGEHADLLRWHFGETYTDADEHRHVHGGNLGISAAAYLRVGGFKELACSEDVALVEALKAAGVRIAWSARPRVTTSARRAARASGGFADALIQAVNRRLQAALLGATATVAAA